MINQQFWHNKKILLTGCTGFKGSWLAVWLHEMGAQVFGYSLKAPTIPSMFESLHLDKKINYHEGDIRDYDKFANYLNQVNPEIVIHLAAQPLVRYSYEHPIETYQTNVLGLVNVLEAIRHNNQVKAVINVTSDKCYENHEWVWGYREHEAKGGYDPYSNSKGCAELVTSCYQNSYFNVNNYGKTHNTLLASGRAGNVIGGGDWAIDRLIPDIIRAVINQQVVKIRNPQSIRPWQHVLEPLSGYLLLAEHLYNGNTVVAGGWNFGPRDSEVKNVEHIVTRLCDLWQENATWQLDTQVDLPHEAHYLKLDCSKANLLLNWQPKWDMDETLHYIVEWYKVYADTTSSLRADEMGAAISLSSQRRRESTAKDEDLYSVTVNQINQYME